MHHAEVQSRLEERALGLRPLPASADVYHPLKNPQKTLMCFLTRVIGIIVVHFVFCFFFLRGGGGGGGGGGGRGGS